MQSPRAARCRWRRSAAALQVVAAGCEETGNELAVRREPGSRTARAEWLGDRCDDADVAAAIREGVVNGRRAASMPADLHQWIASIDRLQNLALRHDSVRAP